jgi:hypothetical protein
MIYILCWQVGLVCRYSEMAIALFAILFIRGCIHNTPRGPVYHNASVETVLQEKDFDALWDFCN